MREEKLQRLLRTLLATTGASSLRITRNPGDLEQHQLRTKLSANVALVASFAQPERGDERPCRRELLERAARELRASHREEHGESKGKWVEMAFPDLLEAKHDPQHLILARIQQFLCALVDSGPFHQQVLMLRGRVIASASPLDKLEEAQLDLISRQIDNAGKAAIGTAHGELVRTGLYGRGFWYGAALIGFCDSDYSLDFTRHQSKLVTRELASLLVMLDGDPGAPVKVAPPP